MQFVFAPGGVCSPRASLFPDARLCVVALGFAFSGVRSCFSRMPGNLVRRGTPELRFNGLPSFRSNRLLLSFLVCVFAPGSVCVAAGAEWLAVFAGGFCVACLNVFVSVMCVGRRSSILGVWGRFRVRGLDPVRVRACGESAAAFALASHSLRECSIPSDKIYLRIVELLKPGHARKCLLVGKWFSLGIWLTVQNLFSRVSCYVSGTVQAKNNL